jgi:hypothetical protein
MAATKRGHVVTVAELEALAILAPEVAPVEIVAPDASVRKDGRAARSWPSYQQCLDRAPESQSRPGHPRDSVADFTWCKIATSWGHSPEATAARLMEESVKAKENGPQYALQTAQRAAWAAAQRSRQQMKP